MPSSELAGIPRQHTLHVHGVVKGDLLEGPRLFEPLAAKVRLLADGGQGPLAALGRVGEEKVLEVRLLLF